MAVSKRLRYEILRRDSHTCRYCGASAPDVPLRVDHVVPVALGGSDEPGNLATSCEPCNSGKSSMPADAATVANVADDALRWATAMEQAADVLLRQDEPKLAYREIFVREWNRWGYGEGDGRKKIELPSDWKTSLERFRVAGLPDWAWAEIVDASMGNKKVKNESKFKYCCGIAWNQVTVIQQEARRLLGATSSATSEVIDLDDPDDLVIEAAHLIWGQEWAATFKKGPTREQAEIFKTSARQALNEGRKPADVLEAALHAVWFGSDTAQGGLEQLDKGALFKEQWVAQFVFERAWTYACQKAPTRELVNEFWEDCEKLYELGAHPAEVALAAAAAGLAATTRMHVGLSVEGLNAIGVRPAWQRAEDMWAQAWKGTSPSHSWPTDDDRTAFRESLEGVRAQGGYWVRDATKAAAHAGAYQGVDLRPYLTRNDSVFLAASSLPGGDV